MRLTIPIKNQYPTLRRSVSSLTEDNLGLVMKRKKGQDMLQKTIYSIIKKAKKEASRKLMLLKLILFE